MNNLHTVTITGADDAVDPNALIILAREFPYVEFGILRSVSRDGTSRYPSESWRRRLRAQLIEEDRTPVRLAMHLCGSAARETMGGSGMYLDSAYQRFQLNGWSNYTLPALIVAKRFPQHEFIAQCTCQQAWDDAHSFILDEYPNVSMLWDPSGGTGQKSARWPSPPSTVKASYAGGITRHNVRSVLDELSAFECGFGIDLESGARTDDRFDIDKVGSLLELCRPYVQEKH